MGIPNYRVQVIQLQIAGAAIAVPVFFYVLRNLSFEMDIIILIFYEEIFGSAFVFVYNSYDYE